MAFTFFFRDQHVLDSIVQHVVPSVMGRSFIRIWDAGCASGEEAYSVAMLLVESLWPFASNNLRIDATDIEENSQFADMITSGMYPSEFLKGSSSKVAGQVLPPCGTPRLRGVRRRAPQLHLLPAARSTVTPVHWQ